jgi:hypothetical protein
VVAILIITIIANNKIMAIMAIRNESSNEQY